MARKSKFSEDFDDDDLEETEASYNITCPYCLGSGCDDYNENCEQCDGTGFINE